MALARGPPERDTAASPDRDAMPDTTDDKLPILQRLKALLILVAVLWGLEVVDVFLLGGGLDRFGILPRSLRGLGGIFAAPFLHGGFGHLAANTGPLLVLGALVMARGLRDFVLSSVVIAIVAGFCVWLLAGSGSVHIGASSVVFGYLGFLVLVGFLERSVVGILVSVGVGLVYGGLIWGVLPGQPGVSWQGHLFGALAGLLAAKWLVRLRRGR